MAKIRYIRNPTQALFHDDTAHRWVMLEGGYGSGKSFALVQKMIEQSYVNSKTGGAKLDCAGAILCPSIVDYKKDIYPLLEDVQERFIPGMKYLDSGKKGKYWLFPWNKKPMYILTAEKKQTGSNLAYIGVNEYSTIRFERIREMIARNRLKFAKRPQIHFVGTPEDDFLWLDEFIEKHTVSERLSIYRASTLENSRNLDPEYIDTLRESLDGNALKLYLHGERIRLDGSYFYYAYDPKVNDWPCEYDAGLGKIHCNVDFNIGRMTATFCQYSGEGKRKQARYFDEIVLTETDSNTEDLGRAINQRYGLKYGKGNMLLTLDAASKNRTTSAKKLYGQIVTDALILKNQGFTVRYKTVNPPMRKRQLQVNGLLSHRNIILNPKTCRVLKLDLMRVEQDKQTLEKVKDKDNKLTHASDGLDYDCSFEFPYIQDTNAKSAFEALKL